MNIAISTPRGFDAVSARSFVPRPKKTLSTIFRLTRVHRSIDEAITRELTHRMPDSFKLLRLKKLRLMVKDRLTRVMTTPAAA